MTNSRLERLEQELGEALRPTDITDAMERLSANYGPPRDRTPDQVRLMVAEWFRALKQYRRKSVGDAIDKHLRTSKWWPTLAEISTLAKDHQDSWVDVLGIGQKPSYQAEAYVFERDGRTVEQEVAHRVAQALRWKADAQFNSKPSTDPVDVPAETRPASTDMTVSDALARTCAVRRSRGLPTCEPGCFRVNCELKLKESD